MKKLILVTAMAVAASWLLHEARMTGREKLVETVTHQSSRPRPAFVLGDGETPPQPPTPPGSIRTIPWKPGKGKGQAKPPMLKTAKGQENSIPSWFPESDADEANNLKPDASGSRVLLGRLSASPDRARQDLREAVEREVKFWIAADVPTYWNTPASAIDDMAQGTYVQEVAKDLTPDSPEVEGLYTLYRAGQKLDFSTARRAEIVGLYRHELATNRTKRLGGGIALTLITLAVLSGYIKADVATKGYYTNRLRLAAAAGLGAAGVAAYRFLV